jgi:hypothetical protein
MNPNSEIDRTRLFRALQWSYRQLEPFRQLVNGLVQEYAGSGYGKAKRAKFETLMNLMNQTVDAYTMALVANRPRVMVNTRRSGLRDFADLFQVALNNLIAEIHLEYTLRQSVLDAFFCVGIVKCHMADSVMVELEPDLWADPGTPFASNVSLDNWVHDMAATKYSRVQFAGDWYRIPFEDLDSDIFDQKVIKELGLQPSSKYVHGDGDPRLDGIITGQETDRDELEPMIDLLDLWVARDKMIYTFPVNPRHPFAPGMKPIAAMPPDDPDLGPYDLLSFNDVPENILPSSPASHLSGLARIINNILRKQSRKAHGQRDIFAYTPAGAKDAERVLRTADQGSVQVQEQSEIKMMKLGGVDQNLQAYGSSLIQIYDRMAGNLTAMMGLGNQAPTLGQEQMIQGSVSKKEAAMQYRVVDHAVRIIRRLGRMLWEDKAKTILGSITHPGLEDYEPADMTWTPYYRKGQFPDYDLDIDIFSMPYQSPAQKFQTMLQLLQTVFVPAGPALAQDGGKINYRKIAGMAAELLSLPQMEEIIEFGQPMPQQQGQGQEGRMPSSTSREYVRRSVPTQGSPQNRATMEQQAWLASQGQGQSDMQTVRMGG